MAPIECDVASKPTIGTAIFLCLFSLTKQRKQAGQSKLNLTHLHLQRITSSTEKNSNLKRDNHSVASMIDCRYAVKIPPTFNTRAATISDLISDEQLDFLQSKFPLTYYNQLRT